MKFGEVFDYRNAEDAKKYTGKRGLFSDNLKDISEVPELENCHRLMCCNSKDDFPFRGRSDGYEMGTAYQFFRPILEEDEPLMTNRQLAEWLAKGYGEYTHENGGITSLAFVYYKSEEDNPVSVTTLIRRWNDIEWSRPTRAIYEEDCLIDTAINKEDCK